MFAPLLSILLGCSEGPLFDNIQGIEVQVVSPNGLKRTHLELQGLDAGAACLDTQTTEVDQAATESRQLLQTTYLILIRDNRGIRNFEMITDFHMKGNKERYYENRCIYDLLKKYAR